MTAHLGALGRGFNWLAGAAVIARIVDSATILVMLVYLTKEQVGLASLVVSIGMVIEACNGLGTGDALIQARTVTRTQLDTVFWYVVGAATLVGLLTLLAVPAIASFYGAPFQGAGHMAAYFAAIAAKQPIVGAALIPLAIMNRNLQYERIAAVNVCATLAAALTRLALGAAGAGAWALVAGYVASGLYTLIGATIAQPFRPRLRIRLAPARPLIRFGVRSAANNIAEQTFKNIDYLLVGWFYGAAPLANYRVAFDVAMEPAMAVGTIVNRAALPVFARVAADRAHLAQTLTWSLHRIAILVAPLMAGLVLAAGPLTALLHDHAGHSYAAAAMPLRVLAVAAPMRLVVQLLATVMVASGRPALAARLSGATLLLLAAGILAAGWLVPTPDGLVAVAAVWLAIYPLLLAWALRRLHRIAGISAATLRRAFALPLLGTAMFVAIVLAATPLTGGNRVATLAIIAAGMALLYAALFRHERRHPTPTT